MAAEAILRAHGRRESLAGGEENGKESIKIHGVDVEGWGIFRRMRH